MRRVHCSGELAVRVGRQYLLALCAVVSVALATRGMAQFDQVLNLPEDGNLPEFSVIPNNTQVNVSGGTYDPETESYVFGSIGYSSVAGDGVTPANIEINVNGPTPEQAGGAELLDNFAMHNGVVLNVRGGNVYSGLTAYDGSILNLESGIVYENSYFGSGAHANILGGSIGGSFNYFPVNGMVGYLSQGFQAYSGSFVDIRGGAVVGDNYFESGADVQIHGDHFLRNGLPVADLGGVGTSTTLQLEPGDTLTAVLSDGTPLALRGSNTEAALYLTVSDVPAPGPSHILIDEYVFDFPTVVREGQTLEVTYPYAGLYSYLGDPPLVVGRGGTANLAGGTFDAPGGVVAHPGSVVNVSGTADLAGLWAESESAVTIAGGKVGNLFLRGESDVTLSGGTVYAIDAPEEESSLEVIGGNFRIDGSFIPILGGPGNTLMVNLGPGEILSGELADGRPFMLAGGDQLAHGVLSLTANAPAPPAETTINVTDETLLDHAREGQTINVLAGGRLPYRFTAGFGSRVNFVGGNSYFGLSALAGSEIVVSSGTVEATIYSHAQSHISIEGGILIGLSVETGGMAEIIDGQLDTANVAGRLRIEGGSVGRIYTYGGGEIELTGGAVDILQLGFNSIGTLVGSGFTVDGVDVTSLLSTTTPYIVTARDIQFAGTLSDGTTFSSFLSKFYTDQNWYAEESATLQLLLAGPPEMLVGDYNGDDIVDAADYVLWRNNLGTTNELANDPMGGVITADHYLQWKEYFGEALGGAGAIAASQQVPEPRLMIGPLVLATVWLLRRRPVSNG